MHQRLGIFRGVNLGGWLSQCDYSADRLMNFITEPDFAQIAAWGLDHVRLPVDYNVLQNEDGSFRPEGFERLDFAIAMCEKYGLKIVLDLHKTAGYAFWASMEEGRTAFFHQEKYQEMFYALWVEIAHRYAAKWDHVVLELLNEVTDQAFMDKWNEISCEAVRRIRQVAPESFVLIGGHTYNNVKAVSSLAAPVDDRVIYNFHSYDPFPFTHQGAKWAKKLDPTVRIAFEDSGATEEFYDAHYADAIAAAKRNGTTLYCGEYGVIDQAKPEDALKWVALLGRVMRKYDIPHCLWTYKRMNFGLADPWLDGVRDELIRAL